MGIPLIINWRRERWSRTRLCSKAHLNILIHILKLPLPIGGLPRLTYDQNTEEAGRRRLI